MFEKMMPGGQAATTPDIDNYIGFPDEISGMELMDRFYNHAMKFEPEVIYEEIVSIDYESVPKKISTDNKEYTADCIIIATGATPRELGAEGESRLRGRGVSYCATCDGTFFKGKQVAVIGGGNTAAEDALYLVNLCEKVYIVHRRDELRADKTLATKVLDCVKIEPIWNANVGEILGENNVNAIKLDNGETLNVSGVFVAVGVTPSSGIVEDVIKTTSSGFIITDEKMQTNIAGVFACGDVRDTPLRQVITAASDGAIAAHSASEYINNN
jgi:thioredoxin reductase (NADPH)